MNNWTIEGYISNPRIYQVKEQGSFLTAQIKLEDGKFFDIIATDDEAIKINQLKPNDLNSFEFELVKLKNKNMKYAFKDANGQWKDQLDQQGDFKQYWEVKLKLKLVESNTSMEKFDYKENLSIDEVVNLFE